MNKPVLFVGLDALLVPGDDPDPLLQATIAPHAKAFMTWAAERYDVRILSERGTTDVFYLMRKMGVSNNSISVCPTHESKIPAVERARVFYWIDAILIPSEVSWLAQHGHVTRYMSVDPEKGIGSEHKLWLETKPRT